MTLASAIKEHVEVVCPDGAPLGTVDRVEGDAIKLTRDGPHAGGRHRLIPLDWVASVDGVVRLNRLCDEARWEWLTVPASRGG
jgi:hypothetical protein